MSHQFTLSKKGLRLIKAFEGFYPVDQVLVTGQRVVGYGHRVRDEKSMIVSEDQAHELLLDDLAPYEDMVNKQVYAPMTQNRFDALVSLAFNIGPRAFENSDVLHALNNGRPLDAANGFDAWRKSEIHGRTYVVDALMRRRAIEKALFLKPDAGPLAASRVRLTATEDRTVYGSTVDADYPVYEEQLGGMVPQVPFAEDDIGTNNRDTRLMPARRRDDGPGGTLSLSEVLDEEELATLDELTALDDVPFDPDADIDNRRGASPIAVAAAEVSERLDALIDETREDKAVTGRDESIEPAPDSTKDWPTSLIENEPASEEVEGAIVPHLHDSEDAWRPPEDSSDLVDDSLASSEETERQDETIDKVDDLTDSTEDKSAAEAVRSDAKPIPKADNDRTGLDKPTLSVPAPEEPKSSYGPYLIMIVTGLTLIGASLGAIYKGVEDLLGANGPFWASVGIMVGAMMVIGALYYVLKSIFTGR